MTKQIEPQNLGESEDLAYFKTKLFTALNFPIPPKILSVQDMRENIKQRHKLVSAVVNNYRYVAFQDENIAGWKASGHGKKIQFSSIGSILADLKHKAVAPLEVDKFFPSTKLCPKCGAKNAPTLADRVYECDCGFTADRDWKSAVCIRDEGLKQIPVERREYTLGEISTSTFLGALSKIKGIQVSKLES